MCMQSYWNLPHVPYYCLHSKEAIYIWMKSQCGISHVIWEINNGVNRDGGLGPAVIGKSSK